MEYRQLIFSELRLAAITFGNGVPDDNALLKAVTVNEELINIGYTLSPEDTVRLAVSPDIDGFVQRIREYTGDVKAEPMYPDFPDQVMKMNEAQFRFHQMIHYLSTYGVEDIFGVKVSKGWLPETENKSEYPVIDIISYPLAVWLDHEFRH